MNENERMLDLALADANDELRVLRLRVTQMQADLEALAQPAPPPPECKTEAEKIAYSFGWWKALEYVRAKQPPQEPDACCAECGKKESDGWFLYCVDCIDEMNTATVQPAQEPEAWISPKGHIHFNPYLDSIPLYTTPPQRPWVDEEAVRADEREACAKVCESRATPGTGSVAILNGAADAIRARGNT